MTPPIQNLLIKAATDVLKRFAFTFAEETPVEDLPAIDSDCVVASIRFTGPQNGNLTLVAPSDFCIEVYHSILGMDTDETTDINPSDALTELLNIVCGEFLDLLAGSKPVFQLGIPESHIEDRHAWQSLLTPPAIGLMTDEHPLVISVTLDPA